MWFKSKLYESIKESDENEKIGTLFCKQSKERIFE